jgi:hypothetical protein
MYDAHDRLLGGIVAIKVLASAFDRDGGLRRAVPPRARAAVHLSQPNIVAASKRVSHDVWGFTRRGSHASLEK